ncbi:hypothetical protein MRB53_003557 [Persea americana]|uniref:Uncharacterized protein n=1 Tax=Persea americana TaxID=3435 RepID=A0ACC2MZC7_PERAE|nr:hypothetical protein MRB53_003557 [Persea americana]
MGKDTDLWDDSALIKAFENAITKCQKVDHKTHEESSSRKGEEEEEATISANEYETTLTNKSVTEVCLSSYNTGASNGLPSIQNDQLGAEFSASESHKHSSAPAMRETTFEGHTESQGVEYSQLLSQYYEIEEQRQKVLHQLHQARCWDCQTFAEGSGSCLQWNACCAPSQEHLPTLQTSNRGHFSYCSTCCCHCLVARCPSMPACGMGGQCSSENSSHEITTACKVNDVRPSSSTDDSIVKAAIEAAEKAISSMNLNTSMTSNIEEEKATAKEERPGASHGGIPQNSGSKTDLTVVLNAWYLAGFYTGKYLSEQSLAKSRH